MKWPGRWCFVAAMAILLIGGICWISQDKPALPKAAQAPAVRKRPTLLDSLKEQEPGDAAARRKILTDWENLMKWLDSHPPPTPEEIQARLLATRVAWAGMDPQLLAEMLKKLLASGDDMATGLGFKVGPHGFLNGWPTLRIFLLDVLAASDHEMAAAIAKDVLDKTPSPDEFAIALRSLTREGMGHASHAELLSRFEQMLGRPEWGNSAGFAEALDLARTIGSPEAVKLLATWNGNPSLKSMAMDEFAAEHPAQMLEILADEQDLGGLVRANLMARADPTDPKQLAAVDAYLRSPARLPEEATAFLQSFPLRSATTGYRLYGKTPAPYNHDQIVAGDRAALERVNQWVNDPALEMYRADLLPLQQRLATWTEQSR